MWVCTVCKQAAETRSAIAQHFRSHQTRADTGNPDTARDLSSPENVHTCNFCGEVFNSGRGLINHERARHQEQLSEDLSKQAVATKVNPQSRDNKWTDEEITKFLAAVNRYGLKSNIMISQYIGTKSTIQVANFKQRYMKKHPLWAVKQFASQPRVTRDQGTQSSPSVSPSTSPSHGSPTIRERTLNTSQELDEIQHSSSSSVAGQSPIHLQPHTRALLAEADKALEILRSSKPTPGCSSKNTYTTINQHRLPQTSSYTHLVTSSNP